MKLGFARDLVFIQLLRAMPVRIDFLHFAPGLLFIQVYGRKLYQFELKAVKHVTAKSILTGPLFRLGLRGSSRPMVIGSDCIHRQ